MFANRRPALLAAASSLVLGLSGGVALADSLTFTTPNVTTVAGPQSVTLNGNTFVNQGLVGVGRLPATLHDFNGETLGSFSGLAFDLSTWRRNANGIYSATLFTLPDRGPNGVGGLATTNYAARLNRFSINLLPYTGAATLTPGTNQLALTQSGGFLLTDSTGVNFTGRDPQAGTVTRNGIVYPSPPAGDIGAGKIAIDSEALTFLNDGSFYVGDEYGAMIYYFNAAGRQVGAIAPTGAIVPRVNGTINYNGANDAPYVPVTTGRRSNQGMEGISVSPDGTRLFAVLQSATLQDNFALNQTPSVVADQQRNNTRVMIYDISATRTPTSPVSEYVLQLPTFKNNGNGGPADKTAAQSEVLALNNSQFLVLSRDGNGRGNGSTRSGVFKSILLVDVNGATNIAGTSYSTGTTPITAGANATGATLVPGIIPVSFVEVVNMLNPVQLGKFGMNLTNNPTNQFSLSEKWEAMGLAPVLEEGAPQDFFLLVGNDNDFISSDVDAAGITNANTSLTDPASGTGDNDNVILVFRLTLPTYIDSQALSAMQVTSPFAAIAARGAAGGIGGAAGAASLNALDGVRRSGGEPAEGFRVWAQGDLARLNTTLATGQSLEFAGQGVAAGVDVALGKSLRVGGALAYQSVDDDDQGFGIEADGLSLSVYGQAQQGPLYGQVAVGFASGLNLDEISRPSAYGQTAIGASKADVVSVDAEAGYVAALGAWRAGPFVSLSTSEVSMDAYTETGASVSNVAMRAYEHRRTETRIGLDISRAFGALQPFARLAYGWADESGDPLIAGLAGSTSAGAVQTLVMPESDDNFGAATVGIAGAAGSLQWRAAVDARAWKTDEVSTRVTIGLAKSF